MNPTSQIWMGKQYLGQSDNAGAKQQDGVDQIKGLFDALMAGPIPRGKSNVPDDEEPEAEKLPEPEKNEGGDGKT
jgi:hypothetical protein